MNSLHWRFFAPSNSTRPLLGIDFPRPKLEAALAPSEPGFPHAVMYCGFLHNLCSHHLHGLPVCGREPRLVRNGSHCNASRTGGSGSRATPRRPSCRHRRVLARVDKSGPACLYSFPRFISGVRAGCRRCRRCRVVHGGGRRLRRTDRRGGQLGAHQQSQLIRPVTVQEDWRSSAHQA